MNQIIERRYINFRQFKVYLFVLVFFKNQKIKKLKLMIKMNRLFIILILLFYFIILELNKVSNNLIRVY